MNEKDTISRRKAIAGLATVIAAPAFGAPGTPNPLGNAAERLEDPTTKYLKPPFKSQSQPWPGLASKMEPRPHHGEQSYTGPGRLQERKALITGGDSGTGRAASIAYVREGDASYATG